MKKITQQPKPKRKIPPQFLKYIKAKKMVKETKAPLKTIPNKNKPKKVDAGDARFSLKVDKKHYSKV